MKKVKLEICGTVYALSVDGAPEYYEDLGQQLNEKMRTLMEENDRVSVTAAAVLSALDAMDELHRSNKGADNLRNQLKEYLEDAASAKSTAENAARELAALRIQLEKSQFECERLRREIGSIRGQNH